MKRKLLLLNLVLLALTALAANRLRQEWLAARARERAVLGARIPKPPAPQPPPAPASPKVTAAHYFDIAQKMLFSKDRNPQVIVEPPKKEPEKPLPPLPLAYGMMDIGDGPIVMMSDKPGARQHGVHAGEKIGEFQLVSITGDEVELAWENRTVKKKLSDLIDHATDKAAGPPQPVAAGPNAAPPPPQGKPEPGATVAEGMAACQAGDTSPPGTVVSGMRKLVTQTPFGPQCRWEAVK